MCYKTLSALAPITLFDTDMSQNHSTYKIHKKTPREIDTMNSYFI